MGYWLTSEYGMIDGATGWYFAKQKRMASGKVKEQGNFWTPGSIDSLNERGFAACLCSTSLPLKTGVDNQGFA